MNPSEAFSKREWLLIDEICGAAIAAKLFEAVIMPSMSNKTFDDVEAALASELTIELDTDGRMSRRGIEIEEILVKVVQFQASQDEDSLNK